MLRLGLAGCYEDVRRFDVAVDEAAGVRSVEPSRDLREQLECPVRLKRSFLLQDPLEVSAVT